VKSHDITTEEALSESTYGQFTRLEEAAPKRLHLNGPEAFDVQKNLIARIHLPPRMSFVILNEYRRSYLTVNQ